METEGVERMGNETEEREIEGVDSETEGTESYNEGVDSKVLHPDRKKYIIKNLPISTTATNDPISAPQDGTI